MYERAIWYHEGTNLLIQSNFMFLIKKKSKFCCSCRFLTLNPRISIDTLGLVLQIPCVKKQHRNHLESSGGGWNKKCQKISNKHFSFYHRMISYTLYRTLSQKSHFLNLDCKSLNSAIKMASHKLHKWNYYLYTLNWELLYNRNPDSFEAIKATKTYAYFTLYSSVLFLSSDEKILCLHCP